MMELLLKFPSDSVQIDLGLTMSIMEEGWYAQGRQEGVVFSPCYSLGCPPPMWLLLVCVCGREQRTILGVIPQVALTGFGRDGVSHWTRPHQFS